MINKFYNQSTKSIISTLKMLFIIMLYSAGSQAQNNSFNCDENAYLFQYNDVYSVDLASGNSFLIAEDVTPGNINAAAYNPQDDFIWGALSNPDYTIVKIGSDFSTTSFTVEGIPDAVYVGAINPDGIYYIKGSGALYHTIDLDPSSTTYTQRLNSVVLSEHINIFDWAFNPIDSLLYSVTRNTNNLCRIIPETGKVEQLGEVPILKGLNYNYGSVYFDNEGRLYVSANQTGTIFAIQNTQDVVKAEDIESNLFAFGPSSSSNDGARCPKASVLQEICDNGIDDDNDGLIDCEDPSCSGFESCDELKSPTSGSNNGGLESNSRLSEQINARNFKRAKSGYKFDAENAMRLKASTTYATRDPNAEIELTDFIPLNCIQEEEAIVATPADLVNITNATDVFSIDYLKTNKSVASILVLKTESGVYEHTKYICDRLLGAELISVSTINIHEKEFIKSIIRNVDGTLEFVLSLSAKEIDNGNAFAVESHWNLDQYEGQDTYYNFQIWSNSIDDLYRLGDEVLRLLEVQRPILKYYTSAPPTVFVKKGSYKDGELVLEIVNTNNTKEISFEAGYRKTETSTFETIQSSIALNGDPITEVRYEVGRLFDIGFRIGDGNHTGDDLFISDGPWGIDDSGAGTYVSEFEIAQNKYFFDPADFAIERDISIKAITNSYVAAYRALTPRYQVVDLSAYKSFEFSAHGTGPLEVILVKEGVPNWEDQMRIYINLKNEETDYSISMSDFRSASGTAESLDNIISIVFTMSSENGELTSKEMQLKNIRFSKKEALPSSVYEIDKINLTAFPNPMDSRTNIEFTANTAELVVLSIYNQLGALVRKSSVQIENGINDIVVNREDLSSGVYVIKIDSKYALYRPLKLIVR